MKFKKPLNDTLYNFFITNAEQINKYFKDDQDRLQMRDGRREKLQDLYKQLKSNDFIYTPGNTTIKEEL